jgi:chlorite dismutase
VAPPVRVAFTGGTHGRFQVERISPVVGESLPWVAAIDRNESSLNAPLDSATRAIWSLHGLTSHQRYVERREADALLAVQPPLGRPAATCAALIPIRKSEAWWDLPQDERRAILEQRSRHITLGFDYLPAVARRLYHGRDLGEPFDFLTWFEYAPADALRFEELVARLRASEEWKYVDRELDIRLHRSD